MKKALIYFLGLSFLLFIHIPEAKAGIFDNFKWIVDGSSRDANYQSERRECQLEVRRLEDQGIQLWENYREESDRQYDLRRELSRCRSESNLLRIDLDECLDQRESSNNEEGGNANSAENSRGGRQSSSESDEYINLQIFDILINGTCEKPKTASKKRQCIEKCRQKLEWSRQEIIRGEERLRNVREAMQKEIRWCRESVESLERQLEECRNGTSSNSVPGVPTEPSTPGTPITPVDPPPAPGPMPGCSHVNC